MALAIDPFPHSSGLYGFCVIFFCTSLSLGIDKELELVTVTELGLIFHKELAR